MKRGAFLLLAMMLCLLAIPVQAGSQLGCCVAQAASPEMPSTAEEVLWTLENYRVDGGIAYYKLYKNSELPAVDVFDSSEASQLQLPMHTYNGVELHRIVTLEVTDVSSEIHWRNTDGPMLHPPTAMKVLQSSWSDRTVTVDGNIEWLEWSDATRRNIRCEGKLPVGVYIKNDDEALYIAISDANDFLKGDMGSQLGIYFDGDHDGHWPAPPCPTEEGVLWVGSQRSLLGRGALFRSWARGPEACDLKEMAPGVGAEVSWHEGQAEWEVRIPLAAKGLGVRPGQTVGLYAWALDWDTMLLDGEWPCGLDAGHMWMHPNEYGDLILAEEPPEEFVPEGSSLILLTSGLLAVLVWATTLVDSKRQDL